MRLVPILLLLLLNILHIIPLVPHPKNLVEHLIVFLLFFFLPHALHPKTTHTLGITEYKVFFYDSFHIFLPGPTLIKKNQRGSSDQAPQRIRFN